jgi:hypothetical protein
MHVARPAFALDPKQFGKGCVRELEGPVEARWTLSSDVKLFATTFAAGFVVVSILIG